ncbi:hypothetical protein TSOC_012638, partial [Tetrabaena socialis]
TAAFLRGKSGEQTGDPPVKWFLVQAEGAGEAASKPIRIPGDGLWMAPRNGKGIGRLPKFPAAYENETLKFKGEQGTNNRVNTYKPASDSAPAGPNGEGVKYVAWRWAQQLGCSIYVQVLRLPRRYTEEKVAAAESALLQSLDFAWNHSQNGGYRAALLYKPGQREP